MAKVEYGSLTVTSTGTKIFVLADTTLQVERVVLFVSDSATVASAGYGDTTVNFNGGSAYADENSTYSLTHYRNVSGTKTKIVEATVPTNSFISTGEFRLSVSILSTPTQIKFVVFGS